MNRSRAWWIGIVLLILGARANTAAAQQQPTSAVSQIASDAGTAYDGKDWAKSLKLYAQIVQTAPNPRAWHRLGVPLNKIGENDKAIEAFEKGSALGLPPQLRSTEWRSSSRRRKIRIRPSSTWKRQHKMD
jgi:Tfp pilus assembly protein PilF